MNVPKSWISEFVDIEGIDNKTLEYEMTMSGTKVEAIESLGKDISGVVVGKIISIEKHPDADKLVVTQIDIGGENPLQIVTGATNVFEGAIVPVAIVSATLAGGLKIKKSKLRGVPSEGMLCSIEELGYTRADYPEAPEDGIYIFDEKQVLGADVCEVLQIKEDVIEFEITSNRPDCYSVLGIAREVSATFARKLNLKEIKVKEEGDGDINKLVSVDIQNKYSCKRYMARVVKNVKIGDSPLWLRHKLTASGIRPINNIVDITNYVMLELGQPLHAFDMSGVKNGEIIVRDAKEGEEIKTLDGTLRKLSSQMLVISDSEKALAIAGVMGGESSRVTTETTSVIFESANFEGTNIRLTSKALGLRTDSSGKYEKGLDPNISIDAVNRCMELVELLGCGEVVKGSVDVFPKQETQFMGAVVYSVPEGGDASLLNKNISSEEELEEVLGCLPEEVKKYMGGHTVPYSVEKINKLLGTNISEKEVEEILGRLFIKAENGIAHIPTFRADIEGVADIAEEVIRIYGFDKIKPTLLEATATVGKRTYTQTIDDMLINTATSLGLDEMMSYSFESPKVFEKLIIPEDSYLRDTVNIINPLGEDFSIMRTSTLNGMLQSLSLNYNRRNKEAALFELSKVYLPKSLPLKELPEERKMLTIGMYSEGSKKDFFAIKGMVEEIFNTLGMADIVEYSADSSYSFMHPGRTASIDIDGENIGFIGEIHPTVQKNYEVDEKVYVATLNVDMIYEKSNLDKNYEAVQKFPAITRDIAMLVKDEITVKEIEKAIKEKSTTILEQVKLFDVYKGEQIKDGFKSVAYSLIFRDKEKTLTDAEVSPAMEKILKNLEEKLGAELRV